jgi:hypothetical protein
MFCIFWTQRSHVMWFFFRGTLHMTRDLCIFCFFHFADDMGVAFFGHVRQLPCHLQAVYMYIMHIRSFHCRVSFLTFHTDRGVFLIIWSTWHNLAVPLKSCLPKCLTMKKALAGCSKCARCLTVENFCQQSCFFVFSVFDFGWFWEGCRSQFLFLFLFGSGHIEAQCEGVLEHGNSIENGSDGKDCCAAPHQIKIHSGKLLPFAEDSHHC